MPRSQVTIRDVAALAGTSVSTVSKYLNSTPYVSERMRKRIADVIEELGYTPNHSARALVRGKSGIIGVLIPSFRNPYQADLLDGISKSADTFGLRLLVSAADRDSQRERRVLIRMLSSGVDGVIVSSAHIGDREVIRSNMTRVPIVLAGRHIRDVDVDYVVIDNYAGGRLAAAHLVELGHQRIAYLDGPADILDFRERRAGFVRELRRHKLALDSKLVFSGSPTPEFGREITRHLMCKDRYDRPTAIFAAADWIAVGALAEARSNGYDIPGDVSIMGFDNVSLWHLSGTPLTTIDAQPSMVGERALALVVQRMQCGTGAVSRERLAPTLVERASTARVSGAGVGTV